MVKHIILWKLKEEANTAEVKHGIKAGLEGLIGVVPGLIEIKVETETLASSNVDVMLYSVFEDEAALKGYAVHPAHVAVADTKVRPFTAVRSCIDFVVD
ncbi:MAG: Dabb family protein [Clostridia bacterium]|nr:Dabb family protein [Clostridia bacterium]